MVDKERLTKELKEGYAKLQKEYGIKPDFESLDSFVYITDFFLEKGFVSDRLDSYVVLRIADAFSAWLGVLHSWILPNPHDYIYSNESKALKEEQFKEIKGHIRKIMYFLRKSKVVIFVKPEELGSFVNESFEYWENSFKPLIKTYGEFFSEYWKKEKEDNSNYKAPDYL